MRGAAGCATSATAQKLAGICCKASTWQVPGGWCLETCPHCCWLWLSHPRAHHLHSWLLQWMQLQAVLAMETAAGMVAG